MDKLIVSFGRPHVSFNPSGDGNVMIYDGDESGRSVHFSYKEFREFMALSARLHLVTNKERARHEADILSAHNQAVGLRPVQELSTPGR